MARLGLPSCVLAVACVANHARAEPCPVAEPEEAGGASDGARLPELRLEHLETRRRMGWTLFGWGVASTLGGVAGAGAAYDDEAWLAASVTTIGFGVVDALLALGLVDLGGERRAAARRGELDGEGDPVRVREAAADAELRSGQAFALNTGLDVFYVATGVLMVLLGHAHDPDERWLEGAGWATVAQGAFLLGFDLWGWVGANRRARALDALGS